MKIKNIIKQTVTMLGKDELLETSLFDGETEIDENQEKEIKLLLFCVNQVLNAIATDYMQL